MDLKFQKNRIAKVPVWLVSSNAACKSAPYGDVGCCNDKDKDRHGSVVLMVNCLHHLHRYYHH